MTGGEESNENEPWQVTTPTEAAALEAAGPIPELELGGVDTGRLGANVGMTFVANVATTAVGVCTGILAARLLGPVGEGQLAAIQTWALLLASLAMLGLPEALVYFIAREPTRGRQFTSTATVVGLASAVVVGAVSWEILPWLLSAQSTAVIGAARVFLLIGVIYAIVGIPHGALRGAQQFKAWNLFRVAPGLAWLGILCVAWASGRAMPIPLSRWYLAGIAAVGLPFLVVTARRLKGPVRPNPQAVARLLRFGLPSVLTTVPQTVNLRLDQLLIIALLPARDLGLYVVAVAWSGPITPLLSAIGSVLFPHISAEPTTERRTRVLGTALQGGLVIGAVMAAVLVVAAPAGIPLVFGSRFESSVTPALLLVPAGAILAWAGVAEEGLRGLGRPGLVLVAELLAAGVTLASLPELLHSHGILGAAIASLLGYFTVATACLIAIARVTGTRWSTFLIPKASTLVSLVQTGRTTLKHGIGKTGDRHRRQSDPEGQGQDSAGSETRE